MVLVNKIPGPPASVLAAILREDPNDPPQPTDRPRRATFSTSNNPLLPSLTTDVVPMPETGELDANVNITGLLATMGWATSGIEVVTSAYTPLPLDSVILAGASGGAFTVTLPDTTQPGFAAGQRYTVIKTDSSANAVTVATTGGQLINGASTVSLSSQYAALSVLADGSGNWWEPSSSSGGGGGSPSGPAGGALAGTYPNPSLSLPVTTSGATNGYGAQLSVTNTQSNPSNPPAGFVAAAAGDKVLALRVSGDTGNRLLAGSDGKLQWGPGGSGSVDTNLYRASTGVLQTDNVFNAAAGLQVGGSAVGIGWVPADNGWLVANGDYAAASAGGAALTAGNIYLQKLVIRQAMTISTLTYLVNTAGSGSSTGSFVGLYNSSGTKLTGSSDIGTAMTSAGTIACSLTTPQALTAGTYVYAAIVTNLATTQPNMPRFLTSTTIGAANLSAAAYRWAVNGTGQTSLPSSLTLSSNGLTANTFFVAGS